MRAPQLGDEEEDKLGKVALAPRIEIDFEVARLSWLTVGRPLLLAWCLLTAELVAALALALVLAVSVLCVLSK